MRGMNLKRYENMGYTIPRRIGSQGRIMATPKTSLLIKVEDLSRGSEVRIDVKCDYCGKVKTMQYGNYVIQVEKDIIKKDCCVKCKSLKIAESNLYTYGVKNPMQLEDVRKRQNDSNRTNIEIVRLAFDKKGFIPLFDTYKNDREKLKCRCKIHTDILQEKTYTSIKDDDGCWYCGRDRISGEKHWNWNGGITDLRVYIHNSKSIKMWKKDSLKYHNYRCMKTRKKKNL